MKNSNTTIKDIATMCNTSFSTVSAILKPGRSNTRFSEKTREMVLETAKKVGYKPNRLARAMISSKPFVIAISMHSSPFKSDDTFYFFDILKNASELLAAKDFETLFITFSSHNEQIEKLKRLKDEAMIAGVISNVIPGNDEFLISSLNTIKLPFVVLGKSKRGPNVISDVSNMEKYISDYAKEKDCSEAFTVMHDLMSPSGDLVFNSITNPAELVSVDKLKGLKEKALIALYGNTVYTTLISSYGNYGNKLLLVEDERRIPIIKPALLVHSLNKERIKVATEMLMQWIEKGNPPEDNQKCISFDKTWLTIVEN